MRLTRYTDYAFRTLMYLALKDGDLSTIEEIADRYHISNNHLMKVVHQLGLAGYIETTRGKGGGIRLAKKPSQINVGEVVRRTESDMDLVECFGGGGSCRLTPACVLKSALHKGLKAFLRELDQFTLADLIRPERTLAGLLALEPPPRARSRIQAPQVRVASD
jgi:Rrf2 family transcriptional regulator, nitric oxide-sensitive transcriptional repressor